MTHLVLENLEVGSTEYQPSFTPQEASKPFFFHTSRACPHYRVFNRDRSRSKS